MTRRTVVLAIVAAFLLGALLGRSTLATPRPAAIAIPADAWHQIEAPQPSALGATPSVADAVVGEEYPDDGSGFWTSPGGASPSSEPVAATDSPLPPVGTSPAPSPRRTAAPATGWQKAVASWYGGNDGTYGNRTACGQTYTAQTWGVAHRSLPCGTLITFRYGGRVATVPVVDRGPFVAGRTWDFSNAVRLALHFDGVHRVDWRLAS